MARLLTIVFCAMTVSPGLASAVDEHGHAHGQPAESATAKAKSGKKFETDAPLRSHMRAIRDDLQSKMAEVHAGKLAPADYQSLAARIDTSIQSIIKECKLKADADAALHVILSGIMAGSSAMKEGPGSRERAAGFLKVAKGLEAYAETFRDPSWKPLKI